MLTFALYRYRFAFRAIDAVSFPPGQAGNTVRGALGAILRRVVPAETYRFLLESANVPRPFVLRCAHLDGLTAEPGTGFFLDAHVFELRRPLEPCFRAVFERFAEEGIGPGRGRAELTSVDQLDLTDPPASEPGPSSISLEGSSAPVRQVTLRFVTPTELKSGGQIIEHPEFAVLFARLSERLCALNSLYGSNTLQTGRPVLPARVHELRERASSVRLTRSDLTWEYASRRSTRTGQVHPLGGFSGETDYEGELTDFLPWLQVSRWTGVGRQTVWGKGDVRVLEPPAANPLRTRATQW